MMNSATSCIKCVDVINTCIYCSGKLVKNGFAEATKQRYKCKDCNKTIVENYTYNACFGYVDKQIVILLTEGVGIRSIARILQISATTLLKSIIAISDRMSLPAIHPDQTAIGIKSTVRPRQDQKEKIFIQALLFCFSYHDYFALIFYSKQIY